MRTSLFRIKLSYHDFNEKSALKKQLENIGFRCIRNIQMSIIKLNLFFILKIEFS